MRLVFENPSYLWLLIVVPLTVIISIITSRYGKRVALKFSNFEAIAKVSEEYGMKPYKGLSARGMFILTLRSLIITLIILALSGLSVWYMGQSSSSQFVLAIDASSSMLATDYNPNRLEAAKDAAEIFIEAIPGNVKLSIISFSGTSFIQQDITDNKGKLKDVIRNIGVSDVGGTDIGGTIVLGSNILMIEEQGRAMILITDGRDNVGITNERGIDYAKNHRVIIHTIGIGTKEGAPFGDSPLTSTLDENSLKKISSETQGSYFHVEDEESMKNSFREIANIKETELSLNLTLPLILAAFAALILQFILSDTRYKLIR